MIQVPTTVARVAFSVLAFLALATADAQQHPEDPRVLLINSYPPDVRWTTELTAGVREGLVEFFPDVALYVDYLQDGTNEKSQNLAQRLLAKQRQYDFDVIVAADDAAYQFMLQHHTELIPTVPVVFCGVSEFSPADLRRNRLITGILQLPDLKKPLRTALLRRRELRRLLVIHDGTPAGIAYRRQVESILPEILSQHPELRVAFLSGADLTTPEMLERVRLAPLDALILFTVWYKGADGKLYPHNDILPDVSRVSPVPVYSVTRLATEYDTSRERLQLAYRQGRAAAETAARILRGVPPAEIPVTVMTHSELEGESIPTATISDPNGRPRRRLSLPGGASLGAALTLAIVFQLAIIVFLFITIGRRRRAQHSLEASRRRLQLVVDELQLGIFDWHIPTGAYEVNTHYAEMLGYLPEEMGPHLEDWKQLVHADDVERVLAALNDYLEDRSTQYHVCYRMRTKNDDFLWVLAQGEVTERDQNGSPIRMVGTHLRADLLSLAGNEREDAYVNATVDN